MCESSRGGSFTFDGGVDDILYKHARCEISDKERDQALQSVLDRIQRDAAAKPVPVPRKPLPSCRFGSQP